MRVSLGGDTTGAYAMLRSVIGSMDLEVTLTSRDKISGPLWVLRPAGPVNVTLVNGRVEVKVG